MKRAFIITICCLLLIPLASCRKKSKSEKEREKITRERMAENR